MKVHITLVGGQPEPVYYGIQYAKPDKVLFVHSSDEKSKEYTDRISQMFPHVENEKRKFDPVNIDDIKRKVSQYADKYSDDDITINISGGTKPWAYYFSTIFEVNSRCQIFYIDQKNIVWNLTTGEKSSIGYDMDVAIGLYGNKIEGKDDFRTISQADLDAIKDIELVRVRNKNIFYALVSNARNNTHLTQWINGRNCLTWDKNNKSFTFSVVSSNGLYVKEIKSPNVRNLVIKAGWFEYKIAQILSHWQYAINVYVNCEFKFANKTSKNEIDIIVNIGNRLVFVECKTQIEQYTDIDKFRSAMRNYSGTATIGLFVTREKMDERAKEKCKDNGIMTFSVAECEAVGKDVENSLINKLDEKINKINAR